ncbi:MAG: endonuclease III [Spirochaetota bacterium]|nr:endonuclease III [Spirochaetota bacterium]
MTQKAIKETLQLLSQHYPDAECSLHYESTLQLLIATILSAQCTDERVNQVTPGLFQRYRTAHDFATANEEELQTVIRSTGFYKNKAKHIIGACQMILSEYDGQIPKSMTKLCALPGVARKTANVVLGNAFQMAEGVVVDTHVTRISRRLGWTLEQNAVKIEKDLVKIIPKDQWINISHRLILHGRSLCQARKAKCDSCFLQELCPSAHKV